MLEGCWGAGRPTSARPVSATSAMSLELSKAGLPVQRDAMVAGKGERELQICSPGDVHIDSKLQPIINACSW